MDAEMAAVMPHAAELDSERIEVDSEELAAEAGAA
jgi:hypothetical protein